MRRLSVGTAAALLMAIWAHAVTRFGGSGTDDFFARWMHDGVIVAAAVACLAAAASSRSYRLAWGALAAGLFSLAVGDLIYSMAPNLDAVPVPSASDPFWLALYPCEYVAVVALTRGRVGRTLWATRLDGLAGGAAAASVLACFTVSIAVHGSAGAPFWEAATNLAYPIGDLVLLGAIVSAIGLAGWRLDRLWATLAASILALEAADLLYLTGALGDIADAIMATGVVGLACAAGLVRPATGARRAESTRGLLVPVGFGSLALGVLALGVPLHSNAVALGLAVGSLAIVLVRMALALTENQALLSVSRIEATTDALTGLANRRQLLADLGAPSLGERVLVMFDLDGFKLYNDTFGHPAGDALLQMIGSDLATAVGDAGRAYRLGGDEFCALVDSDADPRALGAGLAGAMARDGQGFSVKASFGATVVPGGATDTGEVLRLADRRLYICKSQRRGSADHQSADVLLAVLAERTPDLDHHVKTVAALAEAVARRLGMADLEIQQVRRAAVLHDIGKIAIPDGILSKPGPLDADEWVLMRQHTVIGQRILTAAPALQAVGKIVRATHERYDGRGYPDGLAGEAIPLAARIVFACDAYDAMTATRPYTRGRDGAAALAELERCAGTQFDPAVVAALGAELRERSPESASAV
jgi:two-component system, cell cycle response regulator